MFFISSYSFFELCGYFVILLLFYFIHVQNKCINSFIHSSLIVRLLWPQEGNDIPTTVTAGSFTGVRNTVEKSERRRMGWNSVRRCVNRISHNAVFQSFMTSHLWYFKYLWSWGTHDGFLIFSSLWPCGYLMDPAVPFTLSASRLTFNSVRLR